MLGKLFREVLALPGKPFVVYHWSFAGRPNEIKTGHGEESQPAAHPWVVPSGTARGRGCIIGDRLMLQRPHGSGECEDGARMLYANSLTIKWLR